MVVERLVESSKAAEFAALAAPEVFCDAAVLWLTAFDKFVEIVTESETALLSAALAFRVATEINTLCEESFESAIDVPDESAEATDVAIERAVESLLLPEADSAFEVATEIRRDWLVF